MRPTRLLAAAALFATLSFGARAEPLMGNNCQVDVHVFEGTQGTYARVEIEAYWGLMIDADLHLLVNNQEVKVEPVMTNGSVAVYSWIAPVGRTLTCCARVVGRNLTVGDNWLPADTEDCTFYSLEGSSPNAPLPPKPRMPIAGADRRSGARR
jgi:hypothetical protein